MFELLDGRASAFQWDTGLHIDCTGLKETDQVHFCRPGQVLAIHPAMQGEKLAAPVPDELLQRPEYIRILAYATTDTGEHTTYECRLSVTSRPKPPGYVYTPAEVLSFKRLVQEYLAQNGGGLTPAASSLLITVLRNGVYSTDQSANIDALETALGTTGGEVTPDEPDVPVEPDTPHTHSYTSSVTTAATCETAGVRTYTCSCGDSYTEEIPATGHNYEDGVCANCGAADPDYVPSENNGWVSGEPYAIEWTDGYIPDNSTGELTENASWSTSALLPCAGASAILPDTNITGRSGFYWAYDSDGNYLGRTLFDGNYPNAIPSQVKYIKIIKNPSTTSGISPTPVKYDELSETTVWESGTYYEIGHNPGGVNLTTGEYYENAGQAVSNYCMCYGATKLTIYPQNNSYSRRGLVFYDGNKNFVSSATGDSWSGITESEVPENATYFRLVCQSGVVYEIVQPDKPIVTLE